MITIVKTDYKNSDFQRLVQLLNTDLAMRDGETHPLSQFNTIRNLKHVILAYKDGNAIACGAISPYDTSSMEIKRMYVSPEERGQKIGGQILAELESWTKELGRAKCILFMGSKQPEANALYQRNGYIQIQNYGKLKAIPDSLCFEKIL